MTSAVTADNPDGLTAAEIARGDRIHAAIVRLDELGMPNRLWIQTIRYVSERDGLCLSNAEGRVVQLLRSCRDPWDPAGPPQGGESAQLAAHLKATAHPNPLPLKEQTP
jgi:hypothetical protein